MAKQLTQFEPRKPGRKPSYPWDEWLDAVEGGNDFLVERGSDYLTTDKSMAYLIRYNARRRGITVRVLKHDDGLVIRLKDNE